MDEFLVWTVVEGTSMFEFTSFAAAVAYANGFIRTRDLIKIIEPETRIIRLVPNASYITSAELSLNERAENFGI